MLCITPATQFGELELLFESMPNRICSPHCWALQTTGIIYTEAGQQQEGSYHSNGCCLHYMRNGIQGNRSQNHDMRRQSFTWKQSHLLNMSSSAWEHGMRTE